MLRLHFRGNTILMVIGDLWGWNWLKMGLFLNYGRIKSRLPDFTPKRKNKVSSSESKELTYNWLQGAIRWPVWLGSSSLNEFQLHISCPPVPCKAIPHPSPVVFFVYFKCHTGLSAPSSAAKISPLSIIDFVENLGGHPLPTRGKWENCSSSGQMLLHFLFLFPRCEISFCMWCCRVFVFNVCFFWIYIFKCTTFLYGVCVHVLLPFIHFFHPHFSVCVCECACIVFLKKIQKQKKSI